MARVSLTTSTIESCLRGKLKATDEETHHTYYIVCDEDGNRVARTKLSHGFRSSRQLGDNLRNDIKRQLRLQRRADLEALVECEMSREAYLAAVSK